MTLGALDYRHLLGDDVFPALIVAPLRVAQTVWDSEVKRWADFEYMRVAKILGNSKKRTAALNTDADIYIINFENLTWLRKQLGDEWKFKTVVIDECTKLRGHRCRLSVRNGKVYGTINGGGASSATAIAGRARATKYWINLSGTPTPKGAIDLWAQQWVIDFGRALGMSYTHFVKDFCDKPFNAKQQHDRWFVKPEKVDEVLALIKPNTAVLNAYDWFDINQPIEINTPIAMPDKAMDMYLTLHRDSVLQLDENTDIETPSIASQFMKLRQIASGAMLDDNKQLHHIHDARLEALADLCETLDGAPLLVAYYFNYEKDAIIKYFGDKIAVALPKGAQQKTVEDAWNKGKIPMLLIHPASAGHGLNLQHGSNHMVIYTPDWNYELYSQVIERIGTTRQYQAGYDRPVYIYRLYAPNTIDEVILKTLGRKYTNSEYIKMMLAVTQDSLIQPD